MTLTPQMPNGMTAAERLQRANQAKAVTTEAAMTGGSAAVQPPAADPASTPAPAPAPAPAAAAAVATPAARPWEKVVVSEKSASKRLSLIMSTTLRAKLEYLAGVEPGENMSSIAIAGIEAECMRLEKEAGLLPEGEKARTRLEDKHPNAKTDEETRMVVLLPSALQDRMDLLIKEFKLAKDRTKIALPGIEDECNRRLKSRGEL